MIATSSIGEALWPGVNAWFGMAYKAHPEYFREIFQILSSDKNFEEDVSHYSLGLAPKKPEGQKISYDEMAQGFVKRYVHATYALGFVISREAIEDNQYAKVAEFHSKALAKSMKSTKEVIAANVLNRAFNSSYVGADGLELCSPVHVNERDGTTYQNELTTAADMSEASLEQMCIDIMDMKDNSGHRISLMPRKLVIPTALSFEAERILKSSLQNDTANNAINALKAKGILPEGYVVNPYLTDSDAFFILTDCDNGLKMFERRAVAIQNDTDFDSENVKYKASMRFSVGWSDPRCIYGSPGAA